MKLESIPTYLYADNIATGRDNPNPFVTYNFFSLKL